jgi:4a-hydroxytetrahydrobiopterin dehydratase
MTTTRADLAGRHCQACEGGVPPLTSTQVHDYLEVLPGWHLTQDGRRIRREWSAKDFLTALDFFGRIAAIAEAEDHHPDLHLTDYRNVAVELWTHALGALSENDFILAARIDALTIETK